MPNNLYNKLGTSSLMTTEDKFSKGSHDTLKGKRCVICGDKATSCHYNVLSCNGCKTFYRRTVVTGRKFICKKKGRCSVEKSARCACRACRFQKCVEAGMRLQTINLSRSNSSEKRIVEANVSAPKIQTKAANFLAFPKLFQPSDFEVSTRVITQLIHIENCYDYLRTSDYPITLQEDLGDLMLRPCAIGQIAKYKRLSETKNPFPSKSPNVKWYVMDLCLMTEYAKTFEFYNKLSCADQRSLIRQTANTVILLTQTFKSYEAGCDTITFPDGNMPVQDLQFGLLRKEVFFISIPPLRRCKLRREHYVLLKAIIFLTPTFEKLSEEGAKLVNEERRDLCLALHNDLIKEHGLKGAAKLADILSLSQLFTEFAEIRRNNLLLHELFKYIDLNTLARQLITRNL